MTIQCKRCQREVNRVHPDLKICYGCVTDITHRWREFTDEELERLSIRLMGSTNKTVHQMYVEINEEQQIRMNAVEQRVLQNRENGKPVLIQVG